MLLVALLAPSAAPVGAPPWVGRCLAQLRPAALEHGAPLPIDSPRGADHGTCAARCAGHCFLLGDFDGDGRIRELAVAGPSEVLLFHEVDRTRGRRSRATLAQRLPIEGEEPALLSSRRAVRFAEEVGLLRDGKSPLPQLSRSERIAFGLIVWRSGPAEDPLPEGEEEHGRGGDSGDLLLGIYDTSGLSYRLQKVLPLGSP